MRRVEVLFWVFALSLKLSPLAQAVPGGNYMTDVLNTGFVAAIHESMRSHQGLSYDFVGFADTGSGYIDQSGRWAHENAACGWVMRLDYLTYLHYDPATSQYRWSSCYVQINIEGNGTPNFSSDFFRINRVPVCRVLVGSKSRVVSQIVSAADPAPEQIGKAVSHAGSHGCIDPF